MVPGAIVELKQLPLTANGKLDRRALPVPEGTGREYVAPEGESERQIAAIFQEGLQLERGGREGNFFERGGTSLWAMRVISQLRQRLQVELPVRALFEQPMVQGLAAALAGAGSGIVVPANGVPAGCEAIVPAMLPLVDLTAEQIERVVSKVAGGARNVQEIYSLAPLQEGILFHHLLGGESDAYLLALQLSFDSRARLEQYLGA